MSACVINSLSCTVHSHRDWLRRKGSVIVAIVLNHKCHKKHVSTIFFFFFFGVCITPILFTALAVFFCF